MLSLHDVLQLCTRFLQPQAGCGNQSLMGVISSRWVFVFLSVRVPRRTNFRPQLEPLHKPHRRLFTSSESPVLLVWTVFYSLPGSAQLSAVASGSSPEGSPQSAVSRYRTVRDPRGTLRRATCDQQALSDLFTRSSHSASLDVDPGRSERRRGGGRNHLITVHRLPAEYSH